MKPPRLLAFAIETHPPLVYALVCTGWAYSLLGLLRPVGNALPSSAPALALLFFLILLYLRAIDEIKDLPYDRLHHPERPLVRGAVSPSEVAWFAAGVAAVVLALSLWLAPPVAALVAVQLSYGLVLLGLERRWQRFREHIVLNLCITFPVSAVLNALALLYLQHTGLLHTHGLPFTTAVLGLHVAMFLHMELGRKLTWPQHTPKGEHSYSTALGPRTAALLCTLLALLAGALSVALHTHRGAGAWAALPCAAWVLSAIGLRQWARNHDGQCRALKPWFGGAMVVFFGLNAAVGLGT
jgi:4-hydroxybenzoate polyprenyltransferase